MAPEILDGSRTKPYPSIDIWSIGCILFALVGGDLPFRFKDTTSYIKNKGKFNFPLTAKLSKPLKDLISSMLEPDFEKRISLYEAMSHEWGQDMSQAKDEPKTKEVTFLEEKEIVVEEKEMSEGSLDKEILEESAVLPQKEGKMNYIFNLSNEQLCY